MLENEDGIDEAKWNRLMDACTECGAEEGHAADCTVLAELQAEAADRAAEMGGEW